MLDMWHDFLQGFPDGLPAFPDGLPLTQIAFVVICAPAALVLLHFLRTAFILQWLLYALVAHGVSGSDTLQLFRVVPFTQLCLPVAGAFLGTGILVGVGGSLTAIRKFLQV